MSFLAHWIPSLAAAVALTLAALILRSTIRHKQQSRRSPSALTTSGARGGLTSA